MKTKIQAVISVLKVAQDHVSEIKAHPSQDETTRGLIEDVELGLVWALNKMQKLNTHIPDSGATQ